MQKITSIIIDDEEKNRLNLKNILTRYCPEVEVVAMAENADSGYDCIKAHKPKLVFLDVQMPGGTGIEMLERMDSIDFDVIFVTAYD